ncbi:hypothetical protein GCM10023157_29890 [Gluconacetobacter asukensis]
MRAGGDPTRVSCAPVLTADKAAPLRCSETHAGRGPAGRSRSPAHISGHAFEPGLSKGLRRRGEEVEMRAGGDPTRVSCAPVLTAIKAAPRRGSETHTGRGPVGRSRSPARISGHAPEPGRREGRRGGLDYG